MNLLKRFFTVKIQSKDDKRNYYRYEHDKYNIRNEISPLYVIPINKEPNPQSSISNNYI